MNNFGKFVAGIVVALAALICAPRAAAYEPVTAHGTVDGKYAITVYIAQPLDVFTFDSGSYCYDRIIKEKGDKASNYIILEGDNGTGDKYTLTGYDSKGNKVERWKLTTKWNERETDWWLEGIITILQGKNKGKKHKVIINEFEPRG